MWLYQVWKVAIHLPINCTCTTQQTCSLVIPQKVQYICNTTNIGVDLFICPKLSEHCDFADTLDHALWSTRLWQSQIWRVRKPMTWTKCQRQPTKALNICISKNRLTLFMPSRKNPTKQHTTASCYRCSGKHATKDGRHQIFAKSEGEINSAPRLAITHLTSRAARVVSSQFKFENTAMRMEYTESNDVIFVLPPSNKL